MNYQKRNGISTMSDSSKRVTIINSIEYPWVKGMRGVFYYHNKRKSFYRWF